MTSAVDAPDEGPLRILTIANVPPDPNSGAAGTVWATNEAFRAAGHSVDAIWAPDLGPRRIGHGNLHSLIEQPRRYRRAARRAVRRAAAEGRPYDVVQMSQPQAYLAARTLRRDRFPGLVVNRSHGVELRLEAELPKWYAEFGIPRSRFGRLTDGLAAALRRQWRGIGDSCDAVIVPCEDDAESLRQTGWFDACPVRVIPHGVAESLRPESPPPPDRGPEILTVGQAAFYKGPHVALRVVAKALVEEPAARMTWITPEREHGWLREALPEAIRPRVRFRGWGSQADLAEAYRSARVFLFTTLVEGAAKSTLEAMANGCVVVAADHSGMRDAIESGRTGWLCENGSVGQFAERTLAMLRDPDAAAAIGRAAHEATRGFTWERTAADAVRLYRTLAPQSCEPARDEPTAR